MEEAEKLLERTGKYGWIYPDSTHFNEAKDLKKEYYKYKVSKVKIWTGNKENKLVINGIQFFYRVTNKKDEMTLGEHKGETNLKDTFQIELERNEHLTDFHIRIDQEVTQIGFTTSKGKKYLYGSETGEDKIINLKDKDVVIFAPYGCFKNELQSCGVYYFSRKEFMKMYFSGYFELRYLIKKKQGFKENAEKLNLDESNKTLLRVCSLPDNQFNAIIRFCLY
ncbi:MAG: hypothetical protein MJ252_28100 [archaeon]|nr:hypothetical protein [archaeon]